MVFDTFLKLFLNFWQLLKRFKDLSSSELMWLKYSSQSNECAWAGEMVQPVKSRLTTKTKQMDFICLCCNSKRTELQNVTDVFCLITSDTINTSSVFFSFCFTRFPSSSANQYGCYPNLSETTGHPLPQCCSYRNVSCCLREFSRTR